MDTMDRIEAFFKLAQKAFDKVKAEPTVTALSDFIFYLEVVMDSVNGEIESLLDEQ